MLKQSVKNNFVRLGAIGGSLLVVLSSFVIPMSLATQSAQARQVRKSFTFNNDVPVIPPMPEWLRIPSATVVPVNGEVDVKLTNKTNAPLIYEVIGHTKARSLAGQSTVKLKNLPVDVNISFRRQDKGLLTVRPQAETAPGLLEVKLDEGNSFSKDKIAMRVESTGNVFLN